ncbi:PrgI family protein [Heliomicrobium undosum]|nr:PrgI family protein [Heliomicrobium undosum]
MDGEDKVVGGIVSLRQLAYSLLGLCLGSGFGFTIYSLTGFVLPGFLVGILPLGVGLYMAFWKVDAFGMTADQYWRNRLAYAFRPKAFPYIQDPAAMLPTQEKRRGLQ